VLANNSCLVLIVAIGAAACDMPSAEILDAPRVLGLKSEPANLVPGGEALLTALVFDAPASLDWSLCEAAWAPTEPLSCPTGAIALGSGNPLSITWPESLTSAWLQAVPGDGGALPAVKRVEVGTAADNPTVVAIATLAGPLPTTLAAGATTDVVVTFPEATASGQLVVSWYTTGGKLDPGRTLGNEAATLVAPMVAGPMRLIAVVREKAGGTSWTEATLTIGPGTGR